MNPLSRRQFVSTALVAGMAGEGVTSEQSVVAHGARGDGTTDDTAAIQQAVNAGQGCVHFPKGRYRLTKPVIIDLDRCGPTSLIGDGSATVLMEGEGPAFHLRGTHGGTAGPSTVRENVWESQRMPAVSGMEIRGMHPEAIGVCLQGTMQAVLSHLLVRRCRIGIQCVERNRNVIISACHLYHNLAIGIDFDHVNLHQAIIADSHISYNAQAGIRLLGGNMRNFQIVGNDIEYNYDTEQEGCADVLIDMRPEGSSFREGTIVGNTIQARPSTGGANVRFLGGKELRTGGACSITGNFLSNQTINLHLADCRCVTAVGNSIFMGADRTFVLERCANVVVADTTIDWNPRGGGKQFADGILIRDCDGVNLSGVIIEDCFQGSPEAGGAIEVHDSRDVAVSDCRVLDPRHRGIVLRSSRRCRVTGCSVVDRREDGSMVSSIEAGPDCRDTLVAGNTVNRGTLAFADGAGTLGENHEVKVGE